jgi:hypothetical protein
VGLESIITVTLIVVTAFASWMQGRRSSIAGALTTAGDVVGMLSVQVGELRAQLGIKELEIERLKQENRDLAGHCATCQRSGPTAP